MSESSSLPKSHPHLQTLTAASDTIAIIDRSNQPVSLNCIGKNIQPHNKLSTSDLSSQISSMSFNKQLYPPNKDNKDIIDKKSSKKLSLDNECQLMFQTKKRKYLLDSSSDDDAFSAKKPKNLDSLNVSTTSAKSDKEKQKVEKCKEERSTISEQENSDSEFTGYKKNKKSSHLDSDTKSSTIDHKKESSKQKSSVEDKKKSKKSKDEIVVEDPQPTKTKKENKVKKESKLDSTPTKTKKEKSKNESLLDTSQTKSKKQKVKKEPEPAVTPEKTKKAVKTENVKKENNKKVKAEEEIWKWWEENPHPDGKKWLRLEHAGPVFPDKYEPLPSTVHFIYDGKPFKLVPDTEEAATFYAKMFDHEYTTRDMFRDNFFNDWKQIMTKEERSHIVDLSKCDFSKIQEYFKKQSEQKKAATKEEKDLIKKENEKISKQYGTCKIDGHVQKIANYRVEPPSLFRGRGDHPKQGRIKNRVHPWDVTINISKDATIPTPPYGKWKAVIEDNTVSWLACWNDNISNRSKYVLLNATTRLKGEKDMQKFDRARELHKIVDNVRAGYRAELKSSEMRIRQRAVALYFIDKLALRAGNEKDEGETADTVGCCSLRVEHIKLHIHLDGQDFVVEFDFLGKDSIRYVNRVPVEKQVYKNLKIFMRNKNPNDDLFDRLSTASLNRYLNGIMDGLTAKVFRTYNASITLQTQLQLLTNSEDITSEKILSYNRANRAVAILCNHQRAVPKTFDKSMENLKTKITAKNEQISASKKELKAAKKAASTDEKKAKDVEKIKNRLKTLKEQKLKIELNMTDREENKEIALGTSKLNYLDPRISVAWCRKFDVPIEKIYNKSQREKFLWAIQMTEEDFIF